ncbi:MAG: hypothetical protein ACI9S8_001568 [Chlamydiales bacterium]|jgi:hypothetical protein
MSKFRQLCLIVFCSLSLPCAFAADVLTPYTFDTLNKEERVGVDALRVIIPLGDLSDLDMGFIGGRNLAMKENAAFLRVHFYAAQTDIIGTVAFFKKNILLGFDLQRSLGQAGSWLYNHRHPNTGYRQPKLL